MYPGEDTFAGNAWGCVSPVLLITPCPATFEIHLKMFFAISLYMICLKVRYTKIEKSLNEEDVLNWSCYIKCIM